MLYCINADFTLTTELLVSFFILRSSRSPSPLLVALRDDPNTSWIHNCKYMYVFTNFTIAWRWHNCGIKPTLKLSPISVQHIWMSQSVCLYGTRVNTYFVFRNWTITKGSFCSPNISCTSSSFRGRGEGSSVKGIHKQSFGADHIIFDE